MNLTEFLFQYVSTLFPNTESYVRLLQICSIYLIYYLHVQPSWDVCSANPNLTSEDTSTQNEIEIKDVATEMSYCPPEENKSLVNGKHFT